MALNIVNNILIRAGVTGDQNVRRFASDVRGLHSSAKALPSAFSAMRGVLGALGVTMSAVGLVSFARNAISTADQMGKLASRTGMSVEAFSEYAYGAQLADLSNEDLAGSLQKLSRFMNEAAGGNIQAEATLAKFGITAQGIRDGTIGTSEALRMISERFAKMPDGVQKTSLAMALFGRSGAVMIPFLNAGAEGLDDFAAQARAAGVVISTELAEAADHVGDQFDRLAIKARGMAYTMAEDVLPLLDDITTALLTQMEDTQEIPGLWGEIADGLRVVTGAVMSVVSALVIGIDTVITGVRQLWNVATLDFAEAGKLGTDWADRVYARATGLESALEKLYANSRNFRSEPLLGQGVLLPEFLEGGDREGRGGAKLAKPDPGGRVRPGQDQDYEPDSLADNIKRTTEALQRERAEFLYEADAIKRYGEAAAGSKAALIEFEVTHGRLKGASKDTIANLLAEASARDQAAFALREQQKIMANSEAFERERDQLAAMRDEIEMIGATRVEIESMQAAREAEASFRERSKHLSDASKEALRGETEQLLAQRVALIELRYETERTFGVGARRAFVEYSEEATNMGNNIYNVLSSAFSNLEDLFTDFFTKGKASFSDFVNAISADVMRMMVRQSITGPLTDWLGGMMSGGGQQKGDSGLGEAAAALSGAATEQTGAAQEQGLVARLWQAVSSIFQTSAVTSSTSQTAAATTLSSAGFMLGSAATALMSAAGALTASGAVNVVHGGGVIGSDVLAQRTVPMAMFAGAPRFHNGMLASDEYPAILQKGESVLTPAQMKALGSRGGGGGSAVVNITQNVDARGADPASAANIARTLDQHGRALEAKIVEGLSRGTYGLRVNSA